MITYTCPPCCLRHALPVFLFAATLFLPATYMLTYATAHDHTLIYHYCHLLLVTALPLLLTIIIIILLLLLLPIIIINNYLIHYYYYYGMHIIREGRRIGIWNRDRGGEGMVRVRMGWGRGKGKGNNGGGNKGKGTMVGEGKGTGGRCGG